MQKRNTSPPGEEVIRFHINTSFLSPNEQTIVMFCIASMKNIFLVPICVAVMFFAGCVSSGDPANVGKSAVWYQKTDPNQYFENESKRGVVYFIGIYDPKTKIHGRVPGISINDPYFSEYRTWFVPSNSISDLQSNQQFLDAVTEFAKRYNPLVLDYLKSHRDVPLPNGL